MAAPQRSQARTAETEPETRRRRDRAPESEPEHPALRRQRAAGNRFVEERLAPREPGSAETSGEAVGEGPTPIGFRRGVAAQAPNAPVPALPREEGLAPPAAGTDQPEL